MCGGRSKGKSYVWKKKTKIYQTIKGLIILFIKFQFSIRCNQPFRPIAYLNLQHQPQPHIIYLNLSLNSKRSTGLVTCIILMRSYRPDTPHDSRRALAEVSASNQVRSRPTYLLGLGATGLLPRPLSFWSFWLFWRQNWRPHKGEVLSYVQQGFHLHRYQEVLESNTLHVSTSGWSAKMSTTRIIRTLVGRSTILRMYVWRKWRTTSLVAPPI